MFTTIRIVKWGESQQFFSFTQFETMIKNQILIVELM